MSDVTVLGIDLGSSWQSTGTALLVFDAATQQWVGAECDVIQWGSAVCTPQTMSKAIADCI